MLGTMRRAFHNSRQTASTFLKVLAATASVVAMCGVIAGGTWFFYNQLHQRPTGDDVESLLEEREEKLREELVKDLKKMLEEMLEEERRNRENNSPIADSIDISESSIFHEYMSLNPRAAYFAAIKSYQSHNFEKSLAFFSYLDYTFPDDRLPKDFHYWRSRLYLDTGLPYAAEEELLTFASTSGAENNNIWLSISKVQMLRGEWNPVDYISEKLIMDRIVMGKDFRLSGFFRRSPWVVAFLLFYVLYLLHYPLLYFIAGLSGSESIESAQESKKASKRHSGYDSKTKRYRL